jgi:hypothetical protein
MTYPGATAETIQKLERLLADLRRVQAGEGPTADELANAPRLRDWSFTTVPVISLKGIAIKHPALGTNSISTSALFAIADDLSWARTLNRFYRLSDRKFGDRNA